MWHRVWFCVLIPPRFVQVCTEVTRFWSFLVAPDPSDTLACWAYFEFFTWFRRGPWPAQTERPVVHWEDGSGAESPRGRSVGIAVRSRLVSALRNECNFFLFSFFHSFLFPFLHELTCFLHEHFGARGTATTWFVKLKRKISKPGPRKILEGRKIIPRVWGIIKGSRFLTKIFDFT